MKSMDEQQQRSPRERNGARLSRVKTGILVASAAAFAAIGGAVATGGDGGTSPAPAADAVPRAAQEPDAFFGDASQEQHQGGVFAPGQGTQDAPMMRSGGS